VVDSDESARSHQPHGLRANLPKRLTFYGRPRVRSLRARDPPRPTPCRDRLGQVRETARTVSQQGEEVGPLKAERVGHSGIARRLEIGRTSVRRMLAAG